MTEGTLALALGAGMLAAVNPCGFALLPAYLTLLIVGGEQTTGARAVGRALGLTAAMTLGFAAVFAVFGLAIAPVASGVQQHLPWVTLILGLLLVALGVWLLAGHEIKMPTLTRGRLGRRAKPKPLTRSFGSMAGFGAGYAVASLTCTIGPFLAVVVAGFRSDSVAVGVLLFLTYAAGMGLVVGTVAVAVALAKDSVVGRLRRTGRWVPRASGALLVVSGAYVAYYAWWETRVLAGANPDDPVIGAAARVQRAMVDLVQAPGPWGWLLIGLVLVTVGLALHRRRSHRELRAADSAR